MGFKQTDNRSYEQPSSEQSNEQKEAGCHAVIKDDAVSLHSGTNANSKVLKILKRGDMVSIEVEIDGQQGKWCGIVEQGEKDITGYVQCDYLEKSAPEK